MADLSDVTAYLAQQAGLAVYPSGTSLPSVVGMDCLVYEGWPIGDQLDLDIQGKMKDSSGNLVARPGGPRANVSVYPMPGTGAPVYQILDQTYVISPPAINLGVSVSGNTITVTGQPASGEYLTIVADDAHVYSSSGTTTTALLQSLAAAAQANYPSAVATADTLTIPVGHLLILRQGGVAVLGKVTRRQRDSIMVTVWAPNQVARSAIAKAVDNLIKQNIKVAMPDTSQALILYSRTITNDEQQAESIYRRDLIYTAEYATVEQFPGYVITSVQTSIANPSNTAIATAIT